MIAVRSFLAALSAALALFGTSCCNAQVHKKYDTGVGDTEIRIGNIMPYSGPAAAYGAIGKIEQAYFRMINERGGIRGRKISFISYDDAYSPSQTVEQAHKLIEKDNVLLLFGTLGTSTNTAIQKYVNSRKVPQLFVASGASRWDAPKAFPWTMGWQPNYQAEGRIYAKYVIRERPNAKVGVLYQNDDFGKDYYKGVEEGFGAKASMIVAAEAYDTSEPTIDNHIVKLKAMGADTFINISTPKFAAQAIKKAAEIGWKPLHLLANVSTSVAGAIKPAGFENAQGILSTAYAKDGTDPQWDNDPGMANFLAFLKQYYPEGDKADGVLIYGYGAAQTLVAVLELCGDDLTRENVMKQATSLKDLALDMLLPGITINTSPTDYAPIKQLQMMRFKGEKWELFGGIMNSDVGD